MTLQKLKIPEGWGWHPLQEVDEKGSHEITHDCVTKAIHTDIGAKIVMASRFIR